MILYGLKNCDTCRKALRALPGAELVDVSAAPVPESVLEAALTTFGEEALVNRRSTTWRGLSDEDRKQAPVDLLTRYPKLMKRPLIEVDGRLWLGWDKATQEALGAGS